MTWKRIWMVLREETVAITSTIPSRVWFFITIFKSIWRRFMHLLIFIRKSSTRRRYSFLYLCIQILLVWRLSYYLNTEHSILIDDIYMSKSYADMVVGIHTQSKSVWVLFFLSLSLVSYSICLSGWGDLLLLRSTLHFYHRLLDYNPLWNHTFPSVWSGGSRWSY